MHNTARPTAIAVDRTMHVSEHRDLVLTSRRHSGGGPDSQIYEGDQRCGWKHKLHGLGLESVLKLSIAIHWLVAV